MDVLVLKVLSVTSCFKLRVQHCLLFRSTLGREVILSEAQLYASISQRTELHRFRVVTVQPVSRCFTPTIFPFRFKLADALRVGSDDVVGFIKIGTVRVTRVLKAILHLLEFIAVIRLIP